MAKEREPRPFPCKRQHGLYEGLDEPLALGHERFTDVCAMAGQLNGRDFYPRWQPRGGGPGAPERGSPSRVWKTEQPYFGLFARRKTDHPVVDRGGIHERS